MKAAGISGGEGGQYQTCLERGGADNRTLVFGIDVGQVRKSSDEGVTWSFPKQEGLRGGGISSVLVHPADADTLYAYGHFINYKPSSVTGVYKSTDGGENWSNVLALSSISAYDVSCSHHQLEFDPDDPLKIYFGSYQQGFYISTNGGAAWVKKTAFANKSVRWVRVKNSIILAGVDEGEIWRSTDNGDSWVQSAGISTGKVVGALVFLPSDETGNTVYAVRSGDRLYKSTDGGSSFSAVANTAKNGVYLFDISPANSNYMYLMSTDGRYIYYSHNGDIGPWSGPSVINNTNTFIACVGNWIGNASTGMSLSPTNQNEGVVSIGARVYKTADGGATYNPANQGYSGYAHGWGGEPGMFFDKSDSNRMWSFNFDFGAVYTTNGWDTARGIGGDDTYFEDGVSWGSSLFGGVVLPGGRVIAIGGTYFNNTIKVADNPPVWKVVLKDTLTLSSGADKSGAPYPVKLNYAETIRLHPQDSNVVYCANLRTDDSGTTWHPMADGTYRILGIYNKNGDVIYGVRTNGSKSVVYKSSDRGDTWTALPDAGVNIGYQWNGPSGFATDPLTEDRLYAVSSGSGTSRNSIYKFEAGSWTVKSPKPGRQVLSVAVDPIDPRIVYASVDGKGEPSLYKSSDFGATWRSIQYNLPMLADGNLAVSPVDGTLYYNGYDGMWKLSAPFAASFTAVPTNGTAPLQVVFTDTSTGSITNWFWDFGDGKTTNTSSGGIIMHTYDSVGTNTVQLTVSGPAGVSTVTQVYCVVVTELTGASLTASTMDQQWASDGTSNSVGGTTARIGTGSTNTVNTGIVLPFWIPELKGKQILSAELSITLNSAVGSWIPGAANADVFGVRSSAVSNAATFASDYSNGVLLVDNFFPIKGGVNGTQKTNSPALAAWLSDQVGTNGLKFVFLTIRPDAFAASAYYLATVNTANSTNGGYPALVLTLGSPGADTNSNGIPDSWELRYFGGLTNAAALAANGINTILEAYIAGLDPTNPSARFDFSLQQTAEQKTFLWNAISGRVYNVYWTTNLLEGFLPLATNVTWPQNSWTDSVNGTLRSGFYQIKVRLEP